MKAVSGNYINTSSASFLASLVFILFSAEANAACSRDDVEYYLSKGFTNEQITTLCATPSAPDTAPAKETPAKETPASETEKSELENNKQTSSATQADDKALYLQKAIKAKNIKLSSEALQYTQKMCIEYGEEDLFGFTPKVCPEVNFNLTLKGLEVVDTGKKYYFYGTPEVRVKGGVKREIIGGLKDKKPEERKLILKNFEQGDETAIPVRDDFSLEKVKTILQELSN